MSRRILTEDSAPSDFQSFMLDQRAVLEAEFYRTQYPNFDWRNVIITDTSANAWADMVAKIRINYSGETDFIDADSEDNPLVDIGTDIGAWFVHEVKGGFNYGRAEVIRASQAGINLPSEKMNALNLVFERDTCRRVLFGSKKKKHPGFFNWTSSKASEKIPTTAATKSIGAIIDEAAALTTPSYQPIVAYFQGMVSLVKFDQTNMVFTPEYILIPAKAHQKLAGTIFPGNVGSALEAVEKNLKLPLLPHYLLDKNVMQHDDIDSLTKDRCMVGSRRREVAMFHMPMPKRLEVPYSPNGGLLWRQNALQRIGLTDVRIPKAFHYVDMPDYNYGSVAGLTK
ncbi:DUF2184 domain-containing protein (plasmid) [Vibrio harveyi]|uniref:major capsid family protein n=1 Tax=Vibrio harveyi TaxID=669 RepID=UPI00234C0964|nr:major capsid family protein [Vibrio harveyi]WCP84217.1 DUF2184 domain-containing protein [Vibrio harveyi]